MAFKVSSQRCSSCSIRLAYSATVWLINQFLLLSRFRAICSSNSSTSGCRRTVVMDIRLWLQYFVAKIRPTERPPTAGQQNFPKPGPGNPKPETRNYLAKVDTILVQH